MKSKIILIFLTIVIRMIAITACAGCNEEFKCSMKSIKSDWTDGLEREIIVYDYMDIFRNLQYHSEKGKMVYNKLSSITNDYLIQLLENCYWDPMNYSNVEGGYVLVDESGKEIEFNIPIEIPKENRICFMQSNLSTRECDYDILEYEVTDWFRNALFGSLFDYDSFKVPTITNGLTPVDARQLNSKHPCYRVYSKYSIPIDNDSNIEVYQMGFSWGFAGEPWYIIIDKNDLKNLVIKCNEIYPYHEYLKMRIMEQLINMVLENALVSKKPDLNDILNHIIDELDRALTVNDLNIVDYH